MIRHALLAALCACLPVCLSICLPIYLPTTGQAFAQSAEALAAPLPISLPAGTQSGDLIFRAGTEPVSDAVMLVDKGSEFSHVGMLVHGVAHSTGYRTEHRAENNAWYVVHAVPSEVTGRPDGVVMDALEFFTDPARAKHYAVFHVRASQAQRRHAKALAYTALGRGFSFADDYTRDTEGTYCTVLVWHIWQTAGVDLDTPFTWLAVPFMSGHYLLPSALQHSAQLQRLSLPVHHGAALVAAKGM